VTFSSKTADGSTFSSGITFGGSQVGFLQRSFALPFSLGSLNANVDTNQVFDFTVANDSIKNVPLTFRSKYVPKKDEDSDDLLGCNIGASAAYSQNNVNASFGVRTAFTSESGSTKTAGPFVDAALSVGSNGVSLGGNATFNAEAKGFDKYEAGLEYQKDNLVVSAISQKRFKNFSLGVYNQLDSKTQLAVGLDYEAAATTEAGVEQKEGAAATTIFSAAASYQVDSSLGLKVKGSSDKKVSSNVSYNFAASNATVSVDTAFDLGSQKPLEATWGFSLSFGQ